MKEIGKTIFKSLDFIRIEAKYLRQLNQNDSLSLRQFIPRDSLSPETIHPKRQFIPRKFIPSDSLSPETVYPWDSLSPRQFIPGINCPGDKLSLG